MIYLDHAATTPILDSVIDEMTVVMKKYYGNPSSMHELGRTAKYQLTLARETIAKTINASPDEIVFTSSGSESDNLAILKSAELMSNKGKHIISSNIEHPAVKNTLKYLESKGYKVTYLEVDQSGQLTLEQLQQAFTDDTILVTLMYGNNEIGTIFPIQEIAEWLKEKDVIFHTDAVQAFGSEVIDVKKKPVDLLSATAHKVNGPKGIGFLYVRRNLKFEPLIHGGHQENNLRAGTENLPGVIGFAKACEKLTIDYKVNNKQKYQRYRQLILDSLQNSNIDYQVNGEHQHHLPQILSLWIKGVNSQVLLTRLDLQEICISAGSACTAGSLLPSHVISALYGENHPALKETIRISFGQSTTENEILEFIVKLKDIIIELKN